MKHLYANLLSMAWVPKATLPIWPPPKTTRLFQSQTRTESPTATQWPSSSQSFHHLNVPHSPQTTKHKSQNAAQLWLSTNLPKPVHKCTQALHPVATNSPNNTEAKSINANGTTPSSSLFPSANPMVGQTALTYMSPRAMPKNHTSPWHMQQPAERGKTLSQADNTAGGATQHLQTSKSTNQPQWNQNHHAPAKNQ